MEEQLENSESIDIYQDEFTQSYPLLTVERFIFLTILSFGLYQIWWFYKAWKYYQRTEDFSINPALRAIFSIFFLVPLFNKNLDLAVAKGYQRSYNSILLFIGFFAMNLTSYLPAPFDYICFFSFICIVPGFRAFNYLIENSVGMPFEYQSSFNGRQKVIVIIGSVLWFFVLIGLFLGE